MMMKGWRMWFPFLRKSNSVNVNKLQNILIVCLLAVFSLMIVTQATAHPFLSKNKEHKTKTDTLKHPPRDPKKAMLMAIVPGLGQIYNHKYWKLPIVYTGFAVIGYFAVTNRKYYKTYKEAYDYKVSHPDCTVNNPNCTNELAKKYNKATLQIIRDYYRRNMQLSYILGGAWYLLQIIDANVDAHLSHWNISSNLSLEVVPVIQPFDTPYTPAYKGISLRFKF